MISLADQVPETNQASNIEAELLLDKQDYSPELIVVRSLRFAMHVKKSSEKSREAAKRLCFLFNDSPAFVPRVMLLLPFSYDQFFLMRIIGLLIVLLALLGSCAIVGLFAVQYLFEDALLVLAGDSGETVIEVEFQSFGRWSLIRKRLTISDVELLGVVQSQQHDAPLGKFNVAIEQARVGPMSYSAAGLRIAVEVDGLAAERDRIVTKIQNVEPQLVSVTELHFASVLLIEGTPFEWKSEFLQWVHQVNAWAFNGQPIRDLELLGRALVGSGDQRFPVRFHSVKNVGGEVHLEGNADDLRVLAKAIEPKFTEADLQLAAKNLLRAPEMMSIRNRAELQAIRLENRNPEIRYDVPRHIYWSYWLTKSFGADFAREVTAAHEIGDASSSAENTAMDHHHNELGIKYAMRKFDPASV